MCCNRPDYYRNFVWADTGELITAYRKRLKNAAPPIYQWLTAIVGVAVGTLLGLMITIGTVVNPNAEFAFAAVVVGSLFGGLFSAGIVLLTRHWFIGKRCYTCP